MPLGKDVRDRKLVVNEAEGALVQRIFTGFVEIESGTKLVQVLRAEGATTKRGRALTKSEQWDAVHAVLQISPRVRRNRTRCETPAVLRGLIFGSDGHACRRHTREGAVGRSTATTSASRC